MLSAVRGDHDMRATRFTVASVSAGLGSCFMAALPVAEHR
jgi:hypothetical protein